MKIKTLKLLKFVNFLTNWISVVRGMDGFFWLIFFSSALSIEVLGGPSQPQYQASGLEERSPKVLDVIVRMGDPFIEVYLSASGPLNCYDIREYIVERQQDKTKIIPILRRSAPQTPCEPILQSFEDKVADLDPNLESAYLLEVLGFRGWHKREIAKP